MVKFSCWPRRWSSQLGQHGVRIPVVRIQRRIAQAFGFLAVAVHADHQRFQVFAQFGGGGHRMHAHRVVRGVAELVVGVELALAVQVVFRRLVTNDTEPPRPGVPAPAGRRAGTDAHFAEGLRVEVVAADAEAVQRGAVRFRRGVRQRDAVQSMLTRLPSTPRMLMPVLPEPSQMLPPPLAAAGTLISGE
jgi:hypothetical protein